MNCSKKVEVSAEIFQTVLSQTNAAMPSCLRVKRRTAKLFQEEPQVDSHKLYTSLREQARKNSLTKTSCAFDELVIGHKKQCKPIRDQVLMRISNRLTPTFKGEMPLVAGKRIARTTLREQLTLEPRRETAQTSLGRVPLKLKSARSSIKVIIVKRKKKSARTSSLIQL